MTAGSGGTTGAAGATTGAGGSAGASAGRGGTTGAAGSISTTCTPGSAPSMIIQNSLGLAGYGTSTYYDIPHFKWFGYLSTFSYGGAIINPPETAPSTRNRTASARAERCPLRTTRGRGSRGTSFRSTRPMTPTTVVQARRVEGNSSIYVAFASGWMPTMRMSLIASDGTNYCQGLTTEGGGFQAGFFNTACWDGSGTNFVGQDVKTFQVVVPGSASGAQTFSFCISDMGPVMFHN